MIDNDGRKLILARNGLGAAAPTDLSGVLANMRTNQQARAVLGIVAAFLKQGYSAAESIGQGGITWFVTGQTREAARTALNTVNNYAQRVYGRIPDDPGPLSEQNQKAVALTVKQALDAVKLVSSTANDLNRGLIGAITDLLVENILPQWLQNVLPKDRRAIDLALKIGIGLAAVIGIYVAVKLVTNIALRGSDPNEMDEIEQGAIDLAAAQRRRKSARRAVSIS